MCDFNGIEKIDKKIDDFLHADDINIENCFEQMSESDKEKWNIWGNLEEWSKPTEISCNVCGKRFKFCGNIPSKINGKEFTRILCMQCGIKEVSKNG